MTNRLTIELERLAFENHDECVACSYRFQEADTSYWGYGNLGEPLYVCGGCAHLLKEVAQRIYFMNRPYKVPEAHSFLWRYMDFTKFASLLSTKSLYFPSAACFDDAFEGAKGFRGNKKIWDKFYLDFFRKAVRGVPAEIRPSLTDEQVEQEAHRLLKEMETGGEADRQRTFISCWHENEHESEAMWRLYSSYLANAVSIQTTYDRLYDALGRDPKVCIGRVEYVDLRHDFVGVNDAFWRKRKSFEHEREVRAVIRKYDASESGVSAPCDIEKLVERVVVSPSAPAWFAALVMDVVDKYGFKFRVEQSSLIETPFF